MGIFTYENEVATSIPPVKFFKAFILDADQLYPKIVPSHPQTEVLEGDGGPGTIKKISFSHGGNVISIKHRIDVVDEATLTYKYTVLEGEMFSENIEQISKEITVTAGPDGGSVLKSVATYHTKGDYQINEEKVKAGEEKGLALLKAAENYLLANPTEYN
ncbi:major allergen Pru ar 1-like [Momordica charantia]|uniref:Major allergen Pru ar 1-like n=1 Tax=Momordica charantia TaxID=3673 RepID=A0A6J1CC17_MOMCH|nr:major allergen Pru ar 1-like [Momordica charantia]